MPAIRMCSDWQVETNLSPLCEPRLDVMLRAACACRAAANQEVDALDDNLRINIRSGSGERMFRHEARTPDFARSRTCGKTHVGPRHMSCFRHIVGFQLARLVISALSRVRR